MARPRTNYHSDVRAPCNGRQYVDFESGEFLTLVGDPQHCYVLGCIFNKGQVAETLAGNNWASGTRFRTEIKGRIIEYEVSGRVLMKVTDRPSS